MESFGVLLVGGGGRYGSRAASQKLLPGALAKLKYPKPLWARYPTGT
jgi:hypothetical protein